VPQRHIPAYRGREGECGRGQKLFLPCGGRMSCATPPGPRALCEVGRGFYFLRSVLVQATVPQRHTPAYRECERVCVWQGGEIIFVLRRPPELRYAPRTTRFV
jgi:hypothetical protein